MCQNTRLTGICDAALDSIKRGQARIREKKTTRRLPEPALTDLPMPYKQPVLYFGTRLAVFLFPFVSFCFLLFPYPLPRAASAPDFPKSDEGGCPMRQCKNGHGEVNALQNYFTAYLMVAVKRQKCAYIRKQNRIKSNETSMTSEMEETMECCVDNDPMELLPPMEQMEDTALMDALKRLSEKERYVLFGRLLNESEYETLGETLGLRYSGVAAIYRRVIKKLRKELEGGKK